MRVKYLHMESARKLASCLIIQANGKTCNELNKINQIIINATSKIYSQTQVKHENKSHNTYSTFFLIIILIPNYK